jgi:cobalt/nickel transport system permease protein
VRGEGFLAGNISGFASALESVILNEESLRRPGLLQKLDPRVKLFICLLSIAIVGLARSFWILGILFAIILALDLMAKLPLGFFVKRVFLFVPFTAAVAVPALFITPGNATVNLLGKVVITAQGLHTAGFLMVRVIDSVSFGMLLILTTRWTDVLTALRWFRLPALLVDILAMTYRYIFVLLHTANSMFLARRSRTIGGFSGRENRRWLGRSLASTMVKAQHLGEEVYLAMASRGYQGEIRVLGDLKLERRDLISIVLAGLAATILLWSNHP